MRSSVLGQLYEPTAEAERIGLLDLIRGVAVMGILVMNVQSFSMPAAAYINPTAYGELDGNNGLVWWLSHLLADQKFLTLFSMLFGAGVVIMSDRAEQLGRSATKLHYRRMAGLLLIGGLHAYLFWNGDILFSYAVCGMLVFPLRRQSAALLLGLGFVLLLIGSLIIFLGGQGMSQWPLEEVDELRRLQWRPPADAIQQELAVYRGNWWTQMRDRVPSSFYVQTTLLATYLVWRVTGVMLLGMGLTRLRVVTGRRASWVYLALAILGLAFGLAVVQWGVVCNQTAEWDIRVSFFQGTQFNYWGSLLVAAGYVGLLALADRYLDATAPVSWLRGVGRLALTNYLLQTLICTTVFYGHGLAQFGRFSRVAQWWLVIGVWGLQLVLSQWWLRWFRQGPVEWVWRTWTYGRGGSAASGSSATRAGSLDVGLSPPPDTPTASC